MSRRGKNAGNRGQGSKWISKKKRAVKDETERLMLQAFLGSDPKRELLGYMHLLDGADPKRCNCLFEKPLPEAASA